MPHAKKHEKDCPMPEKIIVHDPENCKACRWSQKGQCTMPAVYACSNRTIEKNKS